VIFITIFTYKIATYISTGDVASLQNALYRHTYLVNRVSSGIPGLYSIAEVLLGRIGFGLGLVFSCMLPVDMIFKYVHRRRWKTLCRHWTVTRRR